MFMLLEGGNKDLKLTNRHKTNAEIRAETVEKLWSITEDLNILYKENWTRLAAEEVSKFQEKLVKFSTTNEVNPGSKTAAPGITHYNQFQHQWSFATSYLYSLTLITTIGKFPVSYSFLSDIYKL